MSVLIARPRFLCLLSVAAVLLALAGAGQARAAKSISSAPTLPSADLFDGSRSLKHTVLSSLVYKTLEQTGTPYMVAVACWTPSDWGSVVAGIGETTRSGGNVLMGFWGPQQPRWLHLAPETCADVQGLLSTRRPNGRRADALSTVIHEALHAHGIRNEAQTNCYAVQLVPLFGSNIGMSGQSSSYLGTLARNYARSHAPAGYWDDANCRDGGPWDLEPTTANLGP
jgi:hypothetical protein